MQIAKPFADHRPLRAIALAYGRSLRARMRLPPGDLIDIGEAERAQRRLLVERSARYGPIFKGLMERRLVVCVVGNGIGRRLLREHAAALRPVAIRLESIVPAGFLRRMDGELHRHYRQALVRSLHAQDAETLEAPIEAITAQALARHVAAASVSAHDWAETLAGIAASALITLFFGAAPPTPLHARLLAGFRRLGPHGVVWHITARQVGAYRALCDELQGPAEMGGLLGQLRTQGAVDATMLGNVIYMVELGRYDLRGLLRWIVRYAAEQPAWLERIAAEGPSTSSVAPGRDAATAFVLETLRLEQSERLMRDVEQDIRFDGWLIPQQALLRVCLWEAHKDPQTFAQPFEFDPTRFIDAKPAMGDRFSPFGLDHHHCPLAGLSVRMAAAFLRVLACNYVIGVQGAEPAVRGPYHWEPSPRMVLQLQHRKVA